ncbi:hypothetical protein [Actinoalloteichus sp. AHMU CJ021]|uniref:hypothetical protein n=1 Tax=Actinoalloteichus sp. AHMU CJ021 TaxID=2072503 RepID=UPI00307C4A32
MAESSCSVASIFCRLHAGNARRMDIGVNNRSVHLVDSGSSADSSAASLRKETMSRAWICWLECPPDAG